MTLNFPNAPTNGQIFEGYQYNTAKGVWARANFSAVEASTTNPGIVQLATSAETLTGTATSRAVTPVGLEPLRSRLTATVADFTALSALSTTNKLAGDLAFVVEGAVYMSWTGTVWRQVTPAQFETTATRDTAYAKASAEFRVVRARALNTSTGIESAWSGSAWVLDDTGWLVLPLANGWGSYTELEVYGPAGYRRIGDIVYLRGLIRNGGTGLGGVFATLPVGFRPQIQHIVPTMTFNFAFSSFEIQPNGNLSLGTGASSTWFSLSSHSFSVAS
jgi:hypothetical protein